MREAALAVINNQSSVRSDQLLGDGAEGEKRLLISEDDLHSLVDKSLLGRSEAGRCEMHASLRQFAAEKLQEDPTNYEQAREYHSRFYADFLPRRRAVLDGPEQGTALQEIHAEIDNVRSGWDWATAQARYENIEKSLNTLFLFFLNIVASRKAQLSSKARLPT